MSNRSEQALNVIEPHIADLNQSDGFMVLRLLCEKFDWSAPTEWTCDGCLTEVPDGDGHYVDDMRVCEHCADKLTRIS